MKVKVKKQSQVKNKKVRSNSIIRTRAFVYDLYSKTNSNGRIILNEMVVYHKCGNNILAAMRDREFKRIKVTKDDDRGFEWIGPAPTENMIQDVQNRINEISRKYMQEYIAKVKHKFIEQNKTPMLEFEFDTESDQSKSNPVDNDADVNQLKNLLQKLFGVKI